MKVKITAKDFLIAGTIHTNKLQTNCMTYSFLEKIVLEILIE